MPLLVLKWLHSVNSGDIVQSRDFSADCRIWCEISPVLPVCASGSWVKMVVLMHGRSYGGSLAVTLTGVDRQLCKRTKRKWNPWTMAENITETQSNISFSLSVKVEFLQTPTKSEATRGERKAQSVFCCCCAGWGNRSRYLQGTHTSETQWEGWGLSCHL